MDFRTTLAQCSLFANLTPEALDRLAGICQPVELRGGQQLIKIGTRSDYLYIAVLGRLRAQLADGSVAGDIGRLEPIGEIGLLSGEPAGADVHALRDSLLLRIGRADLIEFVTAHPISLLAMTRTIVHRMRRNQRQTMLESVQRSRSFSIVPGSPLIAAGVVARRLHEALQRCSQGAELIDAATIDSALGPGFASSPMDQSESHLQLMSWLNERESGEHHLLYSAEASEGAWAERCLRQSDRILFLVDVRSPPRRSELLDTLRSLELPAPVDLILLRDKSAPAGDVAGWKKMLGANAHYFLRPDEPGDYAAIARQIAGRGVGLVLSGGGARGFAHIGLIRALEELKIPVDLAGGTSMGAFCSGLLASGHDSNAIRRIAYETFVTHNYLNDYVLPRVSLIRGRKFLARLRSIFGERLIEDLQVPYFCVSSNLTKAKTMVHDSGLMAVWIGTSMAIPGMAPPVVWRGELLVDGAVTNGLPTDIMHALGRGPIIASDVSTEGGLRAPGVEGPDPEALLRRTSNRSKVSLMQILSGGMALTSESGVRQRAGRADLYLRMPISGIALFDWKRLDEIIDRGYEFAMPRLEKFKSEML
jgi:predicted acylesterase/phospholipase RssA/CRP-like cAMP-binding protein